MIETPDRPIATDLERLRLAHREARMTRVVGELRRRADQRRADGGVVPAPLGQAIAGFEQELRTVRTLLAELREDGQRRRS